MDTTELLLAAEVHKLATELRNKRWSEFVHSADTRARIEKDSPACKQVKARWELEHPIAHYVPDATAQLKNVAKQLKSMDTGK